MLISATVFVSSSDLMSVDQINVLSTAAKTFVQDAFRDGVRWSFISLVLWACITLIVTFLLRRISDPKAANHGNSSPNAPRENDGEGFPTPGGQLPPPHQCRGTDAVFEVMEMMPEAVRDRTACLLTSVHAFLQKLTVLQYL